jgi:hypothetical protein
MIFHELKIKKMYGAALKNGAGGDGKQEYLCKVPNQ